MLPGTLGGTLFVEGFHIGILGTIAGPKPRPDERSSKFLHLTLKTMPRELTGSEKKLLKEMHPYHSLKEIQDKLHIKRTRLIELVHDMGLARPPGAPKGGKLPSKKKASAKKKR